MTKVKDLVDKDKLKEMRAKADKKPAYHYKSWSDEEVKFIEVGQNKFTVKELAEKIGRSETAVYQKLMKIEKKSQEVNVKSATELDNIPVMGRVSIINILGKQYVSVKGELYLLSNEG